MLAMGAKRDMYVEARGRDGLWYLVCKDGVDAGRAASERLEWLVRMNAKMRALSEKAADLGDPAAAARMVAFFAQQADGVSRMHDKPHKSGGVYGYCNWLPDGFACTFVEMLSRATYVARRKPAADADAEYFNLATFLTLHEFTHLNWRHGPHDADFFAKFRKLQAFAKRHKAMA